MTQRIAILFLLTITLSCSKKDKIPAPVESPEQYEHFIGDYKVFDSLGFFMYDFSIVHYSETYFQNGQKVDSLVLVNFNDMFNLFVDFYPSFSGYENTFDIGFHDSIIDYNGKSWNVSTLSDDLSTTIRENELKNDTMILYFRQTNIQYYIQEAQPYFFCECKHVAVKQQ